jgi:hypothetical protein
VAYKTKFEKINPKIRKYKISRTCVVALEEA